MCSRSTKSSSDVLDDDVRLELLGRESNRTDQVRLPEAGGAVDEERVVAGPGRFRDRATRGRREAIRCPHDVVVEPESSVQ